MGRRGNGLALTAPGSWSSGNGRGSSSPDYEDRWRSRHTTVPMPLPYRTAHNDSPWGPFEERVRAGPFGLRRFPSQPYSPIRILVLDGDDMEVVNPGLRQFIRNYSPPRIRGEWQFGLTPPEPDVPGLTEEEFSRAMKKLRKQVYNPTQPRKRSWRRGLFSNRNNGSDAAEEVNEASKKDCAICLEAFVPNDQVLVTPCNHMFHSNCLVPWVKSHGQCPVCRNMLCERRREISITNGSGMRDEDLMAMEVAFLIRAMEEAFNYVNLSR